MPTKVCHNTRAVTHKLFQPKITTRPVLKPIQTRSMWLTDAFISIMIV